MGSDNDVLMLISCIVGSVDHRQPVADLRTSLVNGQTLKHAAVLPLRAMLLPSMFSSHLATLCTHFVIMVRLGVSFILTG